VGDKKKYEIKIVLEHAHAWNKDGKKVEICATNLTNKT
jgi:hypothetical protein